MVLTNVLLSISFSLISNFLTKAELPQAIAPRSIEDVGRYHVGFNYAPIDTYVELKNGNEFWIRNGVVQSFLSPSALYVNRDPNPAGKLATPSLTSNEVVALANRVLERLARRGNPVSDQPARVKVSPGRRGDQGAFYEFVWPATNAFGYKLALEIDARRGALTHLDLHDDAFFDYGFASQISNRVYVADAPPKARPAGPRARPTTKQLEEGIASWLKLSSRLGFDAGAQINVASVDWSETYCYTNPPLSSTVPVCRVRFLDGGGFDSLGGSVICVLARDSCYAGDWGNKPNEHWAKFQGRIRVRWEVLAEKLKANLVNRVGLPKVMLDSLNPESLIYEHEIGSESLKRILVKWVDLPPDDSRGPVERFFAEFDVESGEVKLLSFWDRRLREALRKALSGPEPK
jgi:hypothetical protein